MNQNNVRNACGNDHKGKKCKCNEAPKIPPHVKRFFKQRKINFPENGDVEILIGEPGFVWIIVNGKKKLHKWNIQKGMTLRFKGDCLESITEPTETKA